MTTAHSKIKALWKKHSGSQYGPNVEHYIIEEQAFYRFAADFRQMILDEVAEACEVIEREQKP